MAVSRFYRFAVGDCPALVCRDAVYPEDFYPEAVAAGCHVHADRRGAYSHADERYFAVESAPAEGAPAEVFSDTDVQSAAPVRFAAIYSEDIDCDVLFRAWASDVADYPAECLGIGLVEP